MEAELLFRIAAFVVLMFLSACFSASETAFFSLSRVRVHTLQMESVLGRRIALLLERPRRLIISILMGNEIVNIASSAIFTGAVVILLDEKKSWLAPVLMTPLLMCFGEIMPKSIAARFPELFCRFFAIPLSIFTNLIFPLRWVFLQISNGVLWVLGAGSRAQSNILMEDEYLTLVEAGLEGGELDVTEKTYIQNIFEFHDRSIGEITIPRTDMECFEYNTPLSKVIELIRNTPYSRIPVYQGDRDNIVGILYARDFLRLSYNNRIELGQCLQKEMLREPLFVPEGMKLDRLFRLLRRGRSHMAIVADEHGGVAGLVTMRDLLEEIFGEIRGEHIEDEGPEVEGQPDGSFIARARVSLWDFSEKTGWSLPEEIKTNTIGGLVFTLVGRVPVAGEKVRCGNIIFTVMEMDNRRVRKVHAERIKEPA